MRKEAAAEEGEPAVAGDPGAVALDGWQALADRVACASDPRCTDSQLSAIIDRLEAAWNRGGEKWWLSDDVLVACAAASNPSLTPAHCARLFGLGEEIVEEGGWPTDGPAPQTAYDVAALLLTPLAARPDGPLAALATHRIDEVRLAALANPCCPPSVLAEEVEHARAVGVPTEAAKTAAANPNCPESARERLAAI